MVVLAYFGYCSLVTKRRKLLPDDDSQKPRKKACLSKINAQPIVILDNGFINRRITIQQERVNNEINMRI